MGRRFGESGAVCGGAFLSVAHGGHAGIDPFVQKCIVNGFLDLLFAVVLSLETLNLGNQHLGMVAVFSNKALAMGGSASVCLDLGVGVDAGQMQGKGVVDVVGELGFKGDEPLFGGPEAWLGLGSVGGDGEPVCDDADVFGDPADNENIKAVAGPSIPKPLEHRHQIVGGIFRCRTEGFL